MTSHPGGETGSPSVQVREAERAVTPEPLLVEPQLHEGAEASEVWLQTEQEALEYDLQLIAESEGMTGSAENVVTIWSAMHTKSGGAANGCWAMVGPDPSGL